ncbi:MAG: cyanophycinase [Bacteroidales bacterium]
MRNRGLLLFIWILVAMGFIHAQDGYLVIAGGGLHKDNKEVFQEIVRLSGGKGALLGIVPAAGGSPVQSYNGFKEILMEYGLNENQIRLIRIATEDDKSTQEDESRWIRNAYDASVCQQISECTAIWFSGGDQMRITQALLDSNGNDTPALKAIRRLLDRGGMVGGTSAGAAIQSKTMIGGGSSMGALLFGIADKYSEDEVDGKGKLYLTQGLGFFPEGIVDQHFDRRARLGRLALALFRNSHLFNLGFGIDENTALIYNQKERSITVKGKGGVSLIDISSARLNFIRGMPRMQNLFLSYLTSGDSLLLEFMHFIPGKNKVSTRGNEYYQITELPSTGLLSGAGFTLIDFISVYLIDNKSLDRVSQVSFNTRGQGFKIEIWKDEQTLGYLTDLPDDEKYSFWRVRMDIIPCEINWIELSSE